ncbi:UDP-N-acetylglucosamine 1-carboxyvinyltransferase [Thermocrinis minervae]|uniref:UDP-N-acetylglucosamine 1-carboxyvinyltransferase n=1 Tax=Thermocrinis minervae TaxID=381751 RepID=A0A1M6QYG3_9AQUI|nr:UDP-N-acetylglucosamine 1-carboxyvinyltransferase [Thermocrinis minervae]SHK25107.1 UDP-N-acetylglucosamine 1-carboxyvinyltransferase [Thermocrinis minervae]
MISTTSYTSEYFVVEGGKPLKGTVRVSGSKNATLPILMASLLTEEDCFLEDVPDLLDVKNAYELLKHLGARLEISGNSVLLNAKEVNSFTAPDSLVRRMRASILCMGPLLARFGRAYVSMPGGCAIGVRAIDQHLKVFEKGGARISVEHGYIKATVEKIRPVEYTFEVITVTGTENALMFLSMCERTSVLRNIALEPEVMDLVEVLKSMGVEIHIDDRTAIIKGSRELKGFHHRVIPDRIEAGTLLVGAFMTGGDVTLQNVRVDHMGSVLEKLKEAGALIDVISRDSIRIRSRGRIFPLEISTAEYPGFPTDMQAQFMAMLCLADGVSKIQENIFENRFQHVAELNRMGAKIEVHGRLAIVNGVKKLTGAEVFSTDLRASASLVLAGLVAEGTTIVRDVYHLDRGYERLEEKLNQLGACVKRERGEEGLT